MSSLFTVYSHYLTVIRLPLSTSSPNGFMVLTPHYIPPSTEKSCEFPSISRTPAASGVALIRSKYKCTGTAMEVVKASST